MSQQHLPLVTFYKGWDVYQQHLVTAIAPLPPDQLALRAAPHLWSIGMITAHIVATRVWWFHLWMGEGSSDLVPLESWDRSDAPLHLAPELVAGLEATWQMIQETLERLTAADLEHEFEHPHTSEGDQGEQSRYTRQWIIWHLLEHDLHHSGELSLALGMHGLAGVAL